MKAIVNFLSRNIIKIICLAALLIFAGALFGREVRELKDPATGRIIARDRSVVFLWQPSELNGEKGRRVDFHVRRWFFYGLYKVDITGQMAYEPVVNN